MKPFWERDNNIIYQGHALDVLKGMADESVHMCVTSPPYWGLRDYELEPQMWDAGLASVQSAKKVRDCIVNGHKWGEKLQPRGQSGWYTFEHKYHSPGCHKTTIGSRLKKDTEFQQNKGHGQFCQNCGAWRGSLGLEPTPELYVNHIVQIFSEVKRVLRSDGTLWLNLGDSYWGGKGKSNQAWTTENQDRETLQKPQHQIAGRGETRPSDGKHETLKPKDLCMIPARIALALQADGWWIRSDIIWSKTNPMPESVTDRPTKSHEFLYLLTKSHKYYYDNEAVREPYIEPLNRWGGHSLKEETLKHSKYIGMQSIGLTSALREGRDMRPNPAGRNKRSVWTIDDLTLGHWFLWYEKQPEYQTLYDRYAREMGGKKDVWKIPTVPFPEAHFAVYPEKLIEPCILAGTSEKGCCVECGAPWERVVEHPGNPEGILGYKGEPNARTRGGGFNNLDVHTTDKTRLKKGHNPTQYSKSKTIGWKPTCKCDGLVWGDNNPDIIPCTVLDPFFGSGTTGEVAHKYGRNFTVIELGESYLKDIAVPRMETAMKQRKLF